METHSQPLPNVSPGRNSGQQAAHSAGAAASSEPKPRSKLTREFIESFALGVENGGELRFLARAAGFAERTISTWLEIGRGDRETWQSSDAPVNAADRQLCEELFEAVERAQSVKANRMLESLHLAATTINPKTLQPDWRAADTWLSKHPRTRGDWHEADKALQVTHIRSQQDALAEAFDEVSLESAATALALPVHVKSDE